MFRILVVDDDEDICALVRATFEHAGYHVWTTNSAEAALALIQRIGLPHLAIVDLHMPGMDGFEFCAAVQRFSDLPVILLTADANEATIVRGIEQYAEDYVTKPFRPRELLARAGRVLRRIGDFGYTLDAQTRIDEGLAVDFAGQRALLQTKSVTLTPTETKILYLLMRNSGHTVTNDFLLRRLYPEGDVFEDTLRVHIRHLRQKIELNPAAPRYILTQRGAGYRFPRANELA